MNKTAFWISMLLLAIAGAVTAAVLLWPKSSDSNGDGGDDNNNVSVSVAKPKLIAGEKGRIKDNFTDIKDFLPLLDGKDNDYSITAVATCVGTNLAKRVASGELDLDEVLEQMESPDISSPVYSAIIQEETNCGYDMLMSNAEHIAMYQHCVDDDVCTVKDLTSFFQCFIGDSDPDKPTQCIASDNSLCIQQCQPQDLARRNMRARHRQDMAVLSSVHNLL